MSRRLTYKRPFITEQEDADQPSTEDGTDSPSDDDDSKLTSAPSPKKSKKGVHKRVVSVPISDVEGSNSKGDAYPPSDSWAWRKYGQKPIKGSPYPRGYYRCSSSKGCPARKQVERSREEPTMLVITYAHDHNHSHPTAKSHHYHHHSSSSTVTNDATATATSCPSSPPIPSAANSSSNDPTATSLPPTKLSHEDLTSTVFASQPDLELAGDFGWLANVAYGGVLDIPICEGSSSFDNGDVVAAHLSVREDDVDDSLFVDLEELPECSVVFRRRVLLVETDDKNRTCGSSSLDPVQCCASTG